MFNVKMFLSVFLLSISLASACSGADEATGIRFEKTKQGYGVFEGATQVAFYQQKVKRTDKGTHPRNNYLHPVYNLDDQVMTEDYPVDHAHHRGIFWTWHQIFAGDKMMGDAWECRDFVWDITKVSTAELKDGAGSIELNCLWKSPELLDGDGEMKAFVNENTTITFYPKKEKYRVIDFSIVMTALVDGVKLGGSDDSKGYSGFSTRVRMSPTTRFRTSAGLVEPQKDPLGAGPWVDFSHPATKDWTSEGMAILQHPDNAEHIDFAGEPQPWILRQQRSMQNAAWPGNKAVALGAIGEERVLRYRLVIHRGDLSGKVLDRLQAAYSKGE